MANRTLALVRKMFNFAIEHEWLETNPCHMVKRPGEEKQRECVLSEDEIRLFWKALDGESLLIAARVPNSPLDRSAGRRSGG